MADDYILEIESGLIGTLLRNPEELAKIVAKLKPEHFRSAFCNLAYSHMLEDYSQRKPIDAAKIAAQLNSEGYSDARAMLLNSIPPVKGNVETQAELIINNHKAQKLIDLATDISMSTSALNVENRIEECINVLSELRNNIAGQRARHIREYLAEAINEKPELVQANKIYTGFERLDDLLGGIEKTELVILGAQASVGKTALAGQIIANVAKKGKPVIFFSMEMSGKRIAQRLIAKEGLELSRVINKNLDDAYAESQKMWDRYAKAYQKLFELPIYICQDGYVDVKKIQAEISRFEEVGLVVVDFLQLLKSSSRTDNRNLEIGQITRELKVIAMDMNLPILLLSQLNRETSHQNEPTLSNLRDSGEIEQNANKVILLWKIDGNRIGCKVAKNRDGKLGIIQMKFEGTYMRHREIEDIYEPPKTKRRLEYDED